MFLLLYFHFVQIYGFSHVDSAERRVTSIKTYSLQLSDIALHFQKRPIAPIFFHVHLSLQNELQKLEKELNLIHNTVIE